MSVTTIIVATGVAAGVLAIAFLFLTEFLRSQLGAQAASFHIAAAKRGELTPAHVPSSKPGAVIMTPTRIVRLTSLLGSTLIMFVLWHPRTVLFAGGPAVAVMISSVVIYCALFISKYEARYDDSGLMAPNWLLQQRHYPWAEFVQIRAAGRLYHELQFHSGRAALQKYLVGMPTFLTFVGDMVEMNRRA